MCAADLLDDDQLDMMASSDDESSLPDLVYADIENDVAAEEAAPASRCYEKLVDCIITVSRSLSPLAVAMLSTSVQLHALPTQYLSLCCQARLHELNVICNKCRLAPGMKTLVFPAICCPKVLTHTKQTGLQSICSIWCAPLPCSDLLLKF